MSEESPGVRSENPAEDGHEALPEESLISEFWDFLKVRKKFWLGPIIMVLLLLGALIVFTEGSAMSTFIYALF